MMRRLCKLFLIVAGVFLAASAALVIALALLENKNKDEDFRRFDDSLEKIDMVGTGKSVLGAVFEFIAIILNKVTGLVYRVTNRFIG